MSQQFFKVAPTDRIGRICDNNFSELYAASTLALGAGTPFRQSVQLTAAAAATPVHIVPDANVGASQKVYVTDVYLKVGGATAWTDATATKIQIQDTAGTPIVGMTWLKALLTGNAVVSNANASTMLAAMVDGFTAAKGIDLVADAVFGAGSTITMLVCGYIA
jgi:PPE-repeat protein